MSVPDIHRDEDGRSAEIIMLTVSTIVLEVAIVLLLITALRVAGLHTPDHLTALVPIDDASALVLLSAGLALILVHLRIKIRRHHRR